MKMGRTCCILTCRNYRSNSDERVPLFKVPNDPGLFAKWAEAAKQADGSEINSNSFVCERHFQDHEVKRESMLRDSFGNVMLKRPMEIHKLCKQSIPSVFNRDVENPKDKRRKKRKTATQDGLDDTNRSGSLMLTGEESFDVECSNVVVTYDPVDNNIVQLSLVPDQQSPLAATILDTAENLESSPENLSTTDFLVNGGGSTFSSNSNISHDEDDSNRLINSLQGASPEQSSEQSVIPIIVQTQMNDSGNVCDVRAEENVQISDMDTIFTDVAGDKEIEQTNMSNGQKMLKVVNLEGKQRITITIAQEEMSILSENNNNDPPAKKQRRGKQTQIEPLPESESQRTRMEFDMIYKNSHKIKLPNSMWGYHKNIDDDNIIIFSKARWFKSDVMIPPLYEKQVIFHPRDGIKIYVNNKFSPVEARRPRDIPELELILLCVDEAQVCQGGPNTAELDKAKCAMKDYAVNRWRHKLCPVVVKSGDSVCKFCSTISQVHTYLKKKRQTWRRSRSKPDKDPLAKENS